MDEVKLLEHSVSAWVDPSGSTAERMAWGLPQHQSLQCISADTCGLGAIVLGRTPISLKGPQVILMKPWAEPTGSIIP